MEDEVRNLAAHAVPSEEGVLHLALAEHSILVLIKALEGISIQLFPLVERVPAVLVVTQQELKILPGWAQISSAQQLHEGLKGLLESIDAAVPLQLSQGHVSHCAVLDLAQCLLAAEWENQTLEILEGHGAGIRLPVVVKLDTVRAITLLVQLEREESAEANFVKLDAIVRRKCAHGSIVTAELHKALVAKTSGTFVQVAPYLVCQIACSLLAVGLAVLAASITEPAPLQLIADASKHLLLLC
mmetsp:Transcript_72126/g.172275  ORF Transcript_72126/g.172275 Transcript_72126/m.172275 type:complete len:243 (-) Transcript_72126:189-917(-)